MPVPLLGRRCALTAPFHPYPGMRGGSISVALSLGHPIARKPGRALPGALSPWSPDFPPASALRATARQARPAVAGACQAIARRAKAGGRPTVWRNRMWPDGRARSRPPYRPPPAASGKSRAFPEIVFTWYRKWTGGLRGRQGGCNDYCRTIGPRAG